MKGDLNRRTQLTKPRMMESPEMMSNALFVGNGQRTAGIVTTLCCHAVTMIAGMWSTENAATYLSTCRFCAHVVRLTNPTAGSTRAA